MHPQVYQGLNYYRLKQVDFNSTFEYASTIVVNFKADKIAVEIFPSPTTDLLIIKASEEIIALNITNITRCILLSRVFDGIQNTQLNVAQLPTGTYFLSIKTEEAVESLRFIKN